MFKRFIDRIVEAVSERVNPIVVRNVRRMFGHQAISSVIMSYVFLLIFYSSLKLNLLVSDINRSVVTNYAIWRADIFWQIALFGIIFGVLFSVMNTFIHVLQSLNDEMFILTAITPRQYLHAYMFETFIGTCFCMSFFIPVLLIIFSQTSDFLVLVEIIAIMLFCSILISQTAILVVLSFIARLKRPMHAIYHIIVFYISFILFSPIMLPWVLLAFVWTDYFGWQVIYATNGTFGFVSIYILLPIGLLLVGVMAYKLSLYALQTRGESIVKMAIHNILYYTLFNTVMALIYFCIAFVVFTFL
jgi:hypothetical protein